MKEKDKTEEPRFKRHVSTRAPRNTQDSSSTVNSKTNSSRTTESKEIQIENKTNKKFTKIIAVFHNDIWNLTCLKGLDMNRMNINAYTGELEKKEQGSIMDMVRIKKTSEQ